MHILITNDDGIDSPLLQILAQAASARGHRVTVSAPADQQSAKSHAFTISAPLFVREKTVSGAEEAWAVSGTPVDSCRIGMMGLTQDIDLVISGINNGLNAGLATYVSGTVGAAREAAFQGYHAMAVSVEYDTPEAEVRLFADYCVRTGEKLVNSEYPPMSVCNVNYPPVPWKEVRGAAICPISKNIYRDTYERRVSPRGQVYYWLRPMESYEELDPGSDMDLLEKGYITVTFLAPEVVDQSRYADFPLQPEREP